MDLSQQPKIRGGPRLSKEMMESVLKQVRGKEIRHETPVPIKGKVIDARIEFDKLIVTIDWEGDPPKNSKAGLVGEISSYTRGKDPKIRNFRVDNLISISYNVEENKEKPND